MEAALNPNCVLPPSGQIFYQDAYGVVYQTEWETTLSGLDITTVIKQPNVWGQPPQGRVVDHVLYRTGLITVQRQVIATGADGLPVVIAEGFYQSIGEYQATFQCGPGPTDPFCYHYDSAVADQVELVAKCGPRWADPTASCDTNVVWGDVTAAGTIVPASAQIFQFISVWDDQDSIESTCGTCD